MAWTDKANMLLGIDDPARSVDVNAIFDNIPALANGDTGAPDIVEAALSASVQTKLNAGANAARLDAPTSGTAFLNKNIGEFSSAGLGSNINETQGSFFGVVSGCVVTDGDISINVDGNFVLNIGTSTLRIKTYKNDTLINTTDYTASATVSVSDSSSVSQGDVVYFTGEILNYGGSATGSYSCVGTVTTGNDVLGVL